MKTIPLHHTGLNVSSVALGCMNIGPGWSGEPVTGETVDRAERIILAAVENGINLFDHADIYMRGACEEVFGRVLERHPGLRDGMIVQTKCGIHLEDPGRAYHVQRYDFSREHILASVDGSLSRLQCGHLDILLLHRPDVLAEPDEVAAVFDQLHRSGKVRWFGVSNVHAPFLRLLERTVRQPLIVNQLEISLFQRQLIEAAMVFNVGGETPDSSHGTLEYCREKDMLVQAWSPMAQGRPLHIPGPLHDQVYALAGAKQVPPESIVLAWLMRHPAGIQPVVGTTNPDRLRACCHADGGLLSREEWYAMLEAARGRRLP